MSIFKIINDTSDITLNKWVKATKFNSKDKLVDEKGHQVGSDYKGRKYRIIEKRELSFSLLERFGRGLLGTVAVMCTLCLGLFSKSIRNLFTKSKTNIRFALLEGETQFKVENGNVIYIEPQLLFSGTKISADQKLNFALIEIGGKKRLTPVTTALRIEKEYTTYEESALEALFKIAQDKERKWLVQHGLHLGPPINYFLTHPDNSLITEEKFLEFILQNDQNETPRICTLNAGSTLEVLRIIKNKNTPIDLSAKTATGETLFSLWAGEGNPGITELILEIDPSVIGQHQVRINSPFVKAVLNGFRRESGLLMAAMEKEGIVLSQEELWIQRAFKNDCAFSDEEFIQLSQDLKLKVFFAANIFGNEAIVKKLKPLGMDAPPLFFPGPNILARNMDILTTRGVIETFLKNLRQSGSLLTAEEFSQLDKNKYISKTDQIGRIQGKNFIEKLVEENGLKHIKVPKKIAVITQGLENISFGVANSLELIPEEGQLQIYAERVQAVDRKLSLEEGIEFMIIVEKTGYSNLFGNSFFFCEDGIYFIDTEHEDFSPTEPNFEAIRRFKDYVDPKDAEKFSEAYKNRKEAYDREKESREAEQKKYDEAFKNPCTSLTGGYEQQQFTFPLASIMLPLNS